MSREVLNQSICLKEYICEKEYKEVNELAKLCSLNDKTNLKLELDYKLNMSRNSEIGLGKINEFLYYIDDVLVAYLGISSFGGNIVEINGMTHPEFRRKGIFSKLFELSIDECKKRSFDKLLLLSDGKEQSGVEFIKAVGANYDFSEYRMKQLNKINLENINSISLRKAGKLDGNDVVRQNAMFFNDSDEEETSLEEGEKLTDEVNFDESTYMIELKNQIIGKINVEYNENSAFIFGFGILPDFRGKGYGKAALKEALRLIREKNISKIELDVECKNDTALNLYKACGFEEQSIMNYYEYSFNSGIKNNC
jgi:ribosomal protein S18 acetylase RimI-like enzyme